MASAPQTRTFAASQALLAKARELIPGGVTSNVRLGDLPCPLFYTRGEGSRLWDADGNEYIDYVMGRGPLILGHNPPSVLNRVIQAIQELQICAAQSELEIEVAQKIAECVPAAEMLRFSVAGSEAVHAALRLARAHTGRRKIVKFEGHYHGWFDEVLVSTHVIPGQAGPRKRPNPILHSAGQDRKAAENLIVMPWNDLEVLRAAFEEHHGQIAAVIMEPIMFNTAAILPEPGYLEGARRLCDDDGALLIFDEVITGFRVGLGGAQGWLGVAPDLSVFGKAVAGGFPLSVLAGRSEIMRRLGTGEVNHSGTFNGHIAGLAAAAATIDELRRGGEEAFARISRAGTVLMEEIPKLFQRRSVPCLVQGLPCKFFVGFTERRRISDARDALDCDDPLYNRFLSALMRRGVRAVPGGGFNISAAHTVEDAHETLSRMEDALKEIKT